MNNTKARIAMSLVFLSASLSACGKKDEDAKQAPAVESKTVAPVATPPAEDVPAPEAEAELPTAADFEGEAIEGISDKTLEEELSALEKDLGSE